MTSVNENDSIEQDTQVIELRKKRGSIKSRITRFNSYINKLPETLSKIQQTELESRLLAIETVMSQFEEIQATIEFLSENPEPEYDYRETFEDEYYLVTSRARQYLPTSSGNTGSENTAIIKQPSVPLDVKQNTNFPIKLPVITLPCFDGDFNNWLEFRDTYISLVHENSGLDNVSKFHYLRSVLKGDAASLIKTLELTKSNYDVAWQLIIKRYDDSKLLISNHVKTLFNADPILRESHERLRQLSDTFSKNLFALQSLGECTKGWDTLLVHLISTKFDRNTLIEWEQYKSTVKDKITYDNINNFMKIRADLLESIQSSFMTKVATNTNPRPINKTKSCFCADNDTCHVANNVPNRFQCPLCKLNHFLYNCGDFIKLTIEERRNKARILNACFNCLKLGHSVDKCYSGNCKECNKRHNTLLHIKSEHTSNAFCERDSTSCDSQGSNVENEQVVKNTSLSACAGHVLLSTAIIQVNDKYSRKHVARALLDSGSTSCFMTEAFSKKLNLPVESTTSSVTGINNSVSTITKKCNIDIQSMNTNFQTRLSCFILPTITQVMPPQMIQVTNMSIPNNLSLADPEFYKPCQVDILIGAELFWDLLETGQIKLGPKQPTLQNTKLGWVIAGFVGKMQSTRSNIQCNFVTELQQDLLRFWELDSIPDAKAWSTEEKQCEEHFIKTIKRQDDGRFVASIPLKESPHMLGNSYDTALKRLQSMERRLEVNARLKELYHSFMVEYEDLNHMTKIKTEEAELSYYLPHHGVLREDSTTTKLRVVFNASQATTSGHSLNDIQMVGPKIQDDLFNILLRFRQYKIAISSDIEKMYRQVLINPEQRALQRIVWREKPDEKPSIYDLNTVTYGAASAPFLAVRCLKQVGLECKDSLISEIIIHDFYVDDLLTGADSEAEAINLSKNLLVELMKAGFPLRKWRSNSANVIESVENRTVNNSCILGEAKTLGVAWDSSDDVLIIKCKEISQHSQIDKRVILSTISQIFDPLGLVCPCVITGKIFLQQLWLQKIDWNQSLPKEIVDTWLHYVQYLPTLNNIKIPRCILTDSSILIEHHIFCDASEEAYGACIYVKSTNSDGQMSVNLLCAKTRVAPLKPQTIPRLELCGALVASRLNSKVKEALRKQPSKRIFWSDSTIVLSWLKTQPHKLKTFVRNRVGEIQEATAFDEWQYVPSEQNPADILSRGLSPEALGNSSLWWHGPPFLKLGREDWPILPSAKVELPEQSHNIIGMPVVQPKPSSSSVIDISKYSTWRRLRRVCAFVLRFVDNCKNKVKGLPVQTESLTVNELDSATNYIVKIVQQESFREEISKLLQGKQLPHNSHILSLTPFIDSKGILRVGGRLSYSDFDYKQKHPILLPKGHHFTRLLFEHYHLKTMHAGPQLLLNTIRQEFWPINGRNMARVIVRNCVTCVRLAAKVIKNPIMADLPHNRLKPELPFTITGVDYAGPVYIVNKPGRGSKLLKCYICLFVCFTTKAVHIELCSDLTTESYILALKRFISRRGKPTHIYSDNGSNFVGAWNELQRSLPGKMSDEGITFCFIPPFLPHFGGLWEAGVKSVKHHLRRAIGLTHLTYEELYTTLSQIEAILNSRPLSSLSSSPNDLLPLTPGHFTIGRPLSAVPEADVLDVPTCRLPRYKRVEHIRQSFWTRWQKEYVHELQQRVKWQNPANNEDYTGRLVLLKEDSTTPLKWKLGRILQQHPGPDGITRVFTVKTERGLIQRGASRLCPLPDN